MKRYFYLSFLIVFYISNALFGQSRSRNSISGIVIDKNTDKPLSYVNVFIANSRMGATTDKNGKFVINNIPRGTFELVVSMIGYELHKSKIVIKGPIKETFLFKLIPKPIQAPEIVVSAEPMKDWKKNLKKFKKLFLGETYNANECKILNPLVLDFSHQNHVFMAVAQEPLIIENRGLGYKLYHVLENFEASSEVFRHSGTSKFEGLIPKDDKEARRWKENRNRSYRGSVRHFFTALCEHYRKSKGSLEKKESFLPKGFLEEEGFYVVMIQNPWIEKKPVAQIVNTNHFLSFGELPNERKLSFPAYLKISYVKEEPENNYGFGLSIDRETQDQESMITLNEDTVLIDTDGHFHDEFAIKVYGYWAWERVAEILPWDYMPVDRSYK